MVRELWVAKRAWTRWSRVARQIFGGLHDSEVIDPAQNARVADRARSGAIARELWSAGSQVHSYQVLVVHSNLVEVGSCAALRGAEQDSMASPQRRCPFPECPSHGDPRPAKIVRHGFMKSRSGARVRLLCRSCGRTFCSRRGTAYYRLQRARATFDRFVQLLSEGLSAAALARTFDLSPSTVSRWLARAARHAAAFGIQHDRIDKPVELQLDEMCARPAAEAGSPWIFNGIEVWSRYWIATHTGIRSRRSTAMFVDRARAVLARATSKFLINSDPFEYYQREIERAFPRNAIYVHVKNNYRRDWIVNSMATLVIGTRAEWFAAMERSEDSKRTNTSYVERLNLHVRRSCSYLHRRTSGRVRNPARLASAVEVLRCAYNFIRPHLALRFGTVTRTPAMQAGIVGRPLTWREVFTWPLHPHLVTHVGVGQGFSANILPRRRPAHFRSDPPVSA